MFDTLVAGVEGFDAGDAPVADAELCEAMRSVQREVSALQARQSWLTGVWDSRRCWQASGAKSGAAWLAFECRVPKQEAARQVRVARVLRDLPVAGAAWLAGEITLFHVLRLVRARNSRTAEALARDEETLVERARTVSFAEFDRTMANWADVVDPDGSDQSAQDQRDRRKVHLSESFEGMWFGNITLDPIAGAIVADELRRIEADLFLADRAEAKVRLGVDEPTVADLQRSPSQRRADALVEMARRSGTAPADGKKPAPLFTVLVGYETFAGRICELASTSPVAPGSLVPYLDEADIERAVFDAPGHVVEVSEQRCFTGLLRRAIQVRDRVCYHPMCELPADLTQVDHIQPAAWQGPTSQANGRLACGFHNRLRHERTATKAAGSGEEPP